MATLTIDLKNVPVDLKDQIVVDAKEYEELKRRSDYDRWWTPKDLKERYGHGLDWFKEKILFRPEFERALTSCVIRPSGSGKGTWQFEPTKFSAFMREEFEEIGNGF